jgi:hypothetical protein
MSNTENIGFAIDYSNTASGSLLPPGTYEAVIKHAFENITKSGVQYIDVPLIVRNDIEQPHKNKYIFHKIWQKKEPNEADIRCGGYIAAFINSLSKAAGIPNGKAYKSLAELCGDLEGKPVRVTIKHDMYNEQPQVKVDAVEVSKIPDCKHVFKSADTMGANLPPGAPSDFYVDEELSDDDLPF